MSAKDPRVDAYIAKSADFAKPILTEIRRAVHACCPGVEESIKWGVPHFGYRGMLCSIAAFKEHCAFGFWKGSLVLSSSARDADAMGQFGRLQSIADLPSKAVMAAYIRKAVALNDEGVRVPRRKASAPKPVAAPKDLKAALGRNKKASLTFAAFSPSHKREYIEWITEAKTGATRSRRLETAIGWLADGKSRNWKYER